MRVIAGSARGTRLKSPKDERARPTLDRVREALFSILGGRVEDAMVLDLFAGTGAIGIEALSRGAEQCVFVESDRDVVAVIRDNLAAAKVADRAQVLQAALPDALSEVARERSGFDLIYADPPFDSDQYGVLLCEIDRLKLLNSEGVLIVEHEAKTTVPDGSDCLECTREARYGRTALAFFANKER